MHGNTLVNLKMKMAPAGVGKNEEGLFADVVWMLKYIDKLDRSRIRCIFVSGESGVGKSTFAKDVIHQVVSKTTGGVFVPCNVAAIPDSLFESEMFGHTKGAYTGATYARTGLVEEANGGTLFLDEVGKASKLAQAKLLRLLDTGHIRPLGSANEKKVDVVLVMATNEGLGHLVSGGKLLPDLYNRLMGLSVELPSLRKRYARVPEICESLWRGTGVADTFPWFAGEIIAEVVRRGSYLWRGNYHELLGVLRAIAARYGDDKLAAYRKLRSILLDKMFHAVDPTLDEPLIIDVDGRPYVTPFLRCPTSGDPEAARFAMHKGIKLVEKLFSNEQEWWFTKKWQKAQRESSDQARFLSALIGYVQVTENLQKPPTAKQIGEAVGCTERTVQNWQKKCKPCPDATKV